MSTLPATGAKHQPLRIAAGVRGRVVLTVLVVTAVLYSLLGTIGFLLVSRNGRDAIRERISDVLDQLELQLSAGSSTVSIATPDGVSAIVVPPGGQAPPVEAAEIRVERTVPLGGQAVQVVGRASQAPLTDSLRSLYRGLWIGVPLAVLLTACIAWLATRRAFRPVSEITDLAASIGPGDLTTRVPVPDTDDEIEHLARTVNDMLDRIAAGRLAQRRFTSDAAHELRTPLMALQGELELASGGATEPDEALVTRLQVLSDRLARSVDDLVLLSTLDEQPPLERRPVDLAEVARAEVAALAHGDGQAVIIVEGSATADGDERLIARAVRNLVANARRHARAQVDVAVEWQGGVATIVVDDDGPGIPATDREVVFRRFARLDEARDADGGGAGLGLAIVATVAERHGGTVAVTESPLGGARFTLSLPAAEVAVVPLQPGFV